MPLFVFDFVLRIPLLSSVVVAAVVVSSSCLLHFLLQFLGLFGFGVVRFAWCFFSLIVGLILNAGLVATKGAASSGKESPKSNLDGKLPQTLEKYGASRKVSKQEYRQAGSEATNLIHFRRAVGPQPVLAGTVA